MPEISRFFGIVIGMFFDDHSPPHFHAAYGEYRAAIKIDGFILTEGYLPPRALGLVVEWASIHKEALLLDWDAAKAGKPLSKIEPLQ
jgi:hypothetical protein